MYVCSGQWIFPSHVEQILLPFEAKLKLICQFVIESEFMFCKQNMYEQFFKASSFLMFNSLLIKNIFAVAKYVCVERNGPLCSG